MGFQFVTFKKLVHEGDCTRPKHAKARCVRLIASPLSESHIVQINSSWRGRDTWLVLSVTLSNVETSRYGNLFFETVRSTELVHVTEEREVVISFLWNRFNQIIITDRLIPFECTYNNFNNETRRVNNRRNLSTTSISISIVKFYFCDRI